MPCATMTCSYESGVQMRATTVHQVETSESARSDGPTPRPLPGDAARLPLYLFIAVEIVAVPVFLWIGRNQWFFLDEWDFLATCDGGSITDLLSPHNQHWTTVPIILYRLLWNVFGLHTYLPYQLMPVLGHVVVAALLFVMIRRLGVNPWIATAAASLFALFGSGSENIVWAFQITFVGGLMFGLAQLLLADHEGRVDWRDFAAIGCGLLALMFSATGLIMLVVVGLAMFLRRGWQIMLLQTGPPGAVYLAWFVAYGHGHGDPGSSPTVWQLLQYVAEGLKSTYRGLGQLPGLGVLMALAILVGGAMLWKESGLRDGLKRLGVPLTLLVGSVIFILTAATARAGMIYGIASAHQPRYLYIIAAMSLPALAVGVDAITRRWPVCFPLGLALLLVPIPFSVYDARQQNPNLLGDEGVVVIPDMPELNGIPPETLLAVPSGRSVLTLGWLRQVAAQGKLPDLSPGERTAAEVDWKFRLALRQTTDPVSNNCEPLTGAKHLSLDQGESFGFIGEAVQTFNGEPGGARYNNVTFSSLVGPTLEVVVPHVDLIVRSPDPSKPVSICQ